MESQELTPRERLLASARKEFLARGFQNGSLRRICAGAGMSTGAVYFFFENKEDLFCSLVRETAEQMEQMMEEMTEWELERPETGVDSDVRLMEFLYSHREEVLLLHECARGTRYEGFMEEMYDRMRSAFLVFFQKYGAEDADRELIRILVEMRIRANLELLKGDYSMEQAMDLTRQIGIYADGGFRSLTAAMRKEKENREEK